MKNLSTLKIKAVLVAIMLLVIYKADAQQNGKIYALKSGAQYLKQTSVNSASVLQRGNVIINIGSASFVEKTYKVTDANNNGIALTVTTNKITDSVGSAEDHFYFNSDQPVDGSSNLAGALAYMVGKPIGFNVYNTGIIAAVDVNAPKLSRDTLLTFTGIETEDLSAGKRFGLIADITDYNKLKPGDNWVDSSATGKSKTITKFWVERRSPISTTLGYSSSTTGGPVNTNSNGTYVVNNITGIITQRLIQSVTIGYQTYNRIIYSSIRRTSVTENCYTVR